MTRFYCSFLLFLIVVAQTAIAQTDYLPASARSAPDSVKGWTLRHIGDSLVNAGQMAAAQQAYEQALTIAQAGTNLNDLGVSYRAMGYWHESTGDPNAAIGWYLKAMNAFERSGNRRKQARTTAYLGFTYNELNKLPEARRYLLHGIELARQGGYDKELNELYENMAHVETRAQRFDQAMGYMRNVLTYYKTQKDTAAYHGALFNLAMLYKKQQQYARAEQTFKTVLAYATKQKDDYVQGFVYSNLPGVLIPQRKLDEAEAFCQKALAWVNRTNTRKHTALEEINGHLSRIWEERGDHRQALLFYKRQVANHDSVFNETKNRQVADLETRYQTRQKEESIAQLATTNALQRQQLWIGGGSLLVLIGLLGALYWLYRRVQLSRTKIQQQADQLALMMKELHHRVKNNLAIVSSLLRLQSNRLEDEKAVAAVRVGQQRVEAMSMIHQRLYQSDRVSTVDMREYLTDLTHSLMQAYDHQPDAFDLQLDIALRELDIDVAIPLGLIVNELVTNAFKYAYADNPHPSLRISLRQTPEIAANMTLEVQDNGPGIADSNPARPKSFGRRLIASLSEQLEGKAEWLQRNGTLFRLSIPHGRLAMA